MNINILDKVDHLNQFFFRLKNHKSIQMCLIIRVILLHSPWLNSFVPSLNSGQFLFVGTTWATTKQQKCILVECVLTPSVAVTVCLLSGGEGVLLVWGCVPLVGECASGLGCTPPLTTHSPLTTFPLTTFPLTTYTLTHHTPPITTHTSVDRMTDTCFWKYYLHLLSVIKREKEFRRCSFREVTLLIGC